jgi:hypothetical protein
MRGEDVPDAATDSFVKGYENYDGTAAVQEFEQKLYEFYTSNPEMTVEEWAAYKEGVVDEFVSDKADHWLKGFVPSAMRRVDQYDGAVRKRKEEQYQATMLSKTRQVADTKVRDILTDGTISDKPAAVRQVLSQVQAHAKEHGFRLTRNQISEQFVDVVGEMAMEKGRPDWMKFAAIKDDSGMSLDMQVDLAPKVDRYRQMAETRRDQIVAKIDKDRKIAETEVQHDIERAIITSMYSGDYSEAMRMVQRASSVLPPTRLEHFIKGIKQLSAPKKKAGSSSKMTPAQLGLYGQLMTAAYTGEADTTELIPFLASFPDGVARQVMGAAARGTRDRLEEERDPAKAMPTGFKSSVTKLISDVQSEIIEKGEMIEFPKEKMAKKTARGYIGGLIWDKAATEFEKRRDAGQPPPTWNELWSLGREAMEETLIQFPQADSSRFRDGRDEFGSPGSAPDPGASGGPGRDLSALEEQLRMEMELEAGDLGDEDGFGLFPTSEPEPEPAPQQEPGSATLIEDLLRKGRESNPDLRNADKPGIMEDILRDAREKAGE